MSEEINDKSLKNIAELEAPTYINESKVFSLGDVDFYLWDVVKTALAGRLNTGLASGAGMGKSQFFADVQALFGGDSNYILGRNDLDIKSLFRQMNFKKLNDAMKDGGAVSQKELSDITADIYRPLIVVEEINRCAEIVQNQLFNIFEGFIELDGTKYSLGKGDTKNFKDFNDKNFVQNVLYSVGVWTANFGNGSYTGTVSMDKALKERSHLIIDVDNFVPGQDNTADLDNILLGCGGEIRLKNQENPKANTKNFIDAFAYLKQKANTPDKLELGEELLLFRYLIHGLDYIPCESAKNSKRVMKEVWPSKAEEDSIGNDDEKILYRMIFPASVRSAMTIISLARALREYSKIKNPKAKPSVLDSVVESFKLVGAYSGILENPQRIREEYVGNNYLAAKSAGDIIKQRLENKSDLMQAIAHYKSEGKALPKNILNDCKGEFYCFR